MRKPVVVMLSGGLDSTVTAYKAREDNPESEIYPISFFYGQRHGREISCARGISVEAGFNLPKVIHLDNIFNVLRDQTSLLTSSNSRPQTGGVREGEIPSTWVPQRNSLFLVTAAIYAESLGADQVYTGFNAVDYSGYPDCRPEFVEAMEWALNLARKDWVQKEQWMRLAVPLIHLSKKEIVQEGVRLEVPFELTSSCYYGRERACGLCDSCRIRRKAFTDLGLVDPVPYKDLVK